MKNVNIFFEVILFFLSGEILRHRERHQSIFLHLPGGYQDVNGASPVKNYCSPPNKLLDDVIVERIID
jgi:hypothetical protein